MVGDDNAGSSGKALNTGIVTSEVLALLYSPGSIILRVSLNS